MHIRTVHIGDKRHQCNECGKVFSNSSNLNCHYRIHSGEKPFSCEKCDRRFNQSSALARHIKQCRSNKTIEGANQILPSGSNDDCNEDDCSNNDEDDPNLSINVVSMPPPAATSVTTATVDNQSLTIHSISNIIAEKEIDVCEMDTLPNITNIHSTQMMYAGGGNSSSANIVNYNFDPFGGYMQRMPENRTHFMEHMDCMKYSTNNMDGYRAMIEYVNENVGPYN